MNKKVKRRTAPTPVGLYPLTREAANLSRAHAAVLAVVQVITIYKGCP